MNKFGGSISAILYAGDPSHLSRNFLATVSILICTASYRFIEGPLIRMAHRKFQFETSAVDKVGDAGVRSPT